MAQPSTGQAWTEVYGFNQLGIRKGIIWHTPNVIPLTKAEVDAEVARLESVEAERVAGEAAARAAAVSHAKSLGFTDEMITVMYPSLGAQA